MAQKKNKRQWCSATGVSLRDKLAYQRELKAAINRQAHDAISTLVTEQSIENGRKNAAKCWNSRAR